MRKLILIIAIFLMHVADAQPSNLLWIQQPAISPDGKWIAFEYKSNIFKVPATGGDAIPLTFNGAYNGFPVWSHDGSKIAFASDRYGNFDVFIMPATGGNAKRLTFNSAKDIPYDFSGDDKQVYFGTPRHDVYTSARFPEDELWMKLYKVPVNGGPDLMVNSAGTEFVHFNKAGNKFIFQDAKGYENYYRKHHTSAVTRDIWVYDLDTKAYIKVSDFKGEDREPVWGEDDTFYYLSERNGDQNLFKSDLTRPGNVRQLTTFTKNPVRNLSRSDNGVFAFTQDGDLYTLQEGDAPKKVTITLSVDFDADQIKNIPVKDASEVAISPNGKEIAFVSRGELFVTATDGSGTKKITNTANRERMIDFSPDGRSLLYSVEAGGSWDIYKASIVNKSEPYFSSATIIKSEAVIATPQDEFKGVYSPDGKSIAYLEERNIVKVYNIVTKSTATISPEGLNYSYRDGDQNFVWSPDGQYLLLSSSEGYSGPRNIILVKADGTGKRINLTQSGFDAGNQQWGVNGKMMIYESGKYGLTNLSQGWNQSDIYAMYFDKPLFDNFHLTKTELLLKNEMSKNDSAKRVTIKKGKNNVPAPDSVERFEAQYNLAPDILADRTVRLTANSALLSDFKLSVDGEKLYYVAKYENNCDLWVMDVRTRDTKILTKLNARGASLYLSKDAKTLFTLADGNIFKIDVENGNKTQVAINTTIEWNAAGERAYIFEHTYNLLLKKFWDPKLQGVDWKYYHDEYLQFLPHINNDYDFQILLSEFLGELNSSHTGAVYRPNIPDGDATAALGLLYDQAKSGNGLSVTHVLEDGPFDLAGSHMAKGCIIDQIDGVDINREANWSALLNNKTGKYTLISFHNPKTNVAYTETVKPVSSNDETNTLLYNRWIHLMAHLTDSLSGGQVGYVHIRDMDEENLRNTMDAIEGKNAGKKAVIIDTRFNHGGNLHEQLTTFLGEKIHILPRPQSHRVPDNALRDGSRKPSCVLMSEGNYSDAFNFPYEYQKLGLGKIIGMPVAGTGTGVYWERQVNNSLIIGIPQLGLSWIGEDTLLENHQIEPDIEVNNEYNQILTGHDQQLEAAVKEMLKEIKAAN